jgi:hypothetical protein
MTLFARSDVASVHVPAEDFGGCAQTHRRPVVNGAPAQVWALDCPSCENHLRHSDQWGVTASEIPETHDEGKAREDFDKRGAKDKDAILTLALARLAGIDSAELPESLTRMISGAPLHVPVQGQMECPDGHGQPAGSRFCNQCGSPMSQPATKAALSAPQRAAEPAPAAAPPPSALRAQRLRDARLETLQALARSRDLDADGTRPDLISRLAAAGVTNADLQRFLEPAAV